MTSKALRTRCVIAMLMSVVWLLTQASRVYAEEQVIHLRTEAQDTAPKWILSEQHGRMNIGGVCADILRAIERESTRIHFDWTHEFVPLKRIFKHLADGKIDLVVGYAHEAERAEHLIYSQTPLYQVKHVLAVRKDDPVQVKSFEELAALGEQGKVLTVFGGATAAYLKQQPGVIVDDLGKTPEIVLQRLLKKRGRFFYYYDYGMRYAIKENGLQDRVRILPHSFQIYPHYIMYSRSLAQELIDEIEHILRNLAERGELERIYQKYYTQF